MTETLTRVFPARRFRWLELPRVLHAVTDSVRHTERLYEALPTACAWLPTYLARHHSEALSDVCGPTDKRSISGVKLEAIKVDTEATELLLDLIEAESV